MFRCIALTLLSLVIPPVPCWTAVLSSAFPPAFNNSSLFSKTRRLEKFKDGFQVLTWGFQYVPLLKCNVAAPALNQSWIISNVGSKCLFFFSLQLLWVIPQGESSLEMGVGRGNTFLKRSLCDSTVDDGSIPKPGKAFVFLFQVFFTK